MGRARGPAIVQAGPGRSWRIEDSRRTGPSRLVAEANGTNDGDTVEKVASLSIESALARNFDAALDESASIVAKEN